MRWFTVPMMVIALAMALLGGGSRALADEPPATKAEWIAALSKMTLQGGDHQNLQRFVQANPELVYATLKEGWTQIGNATVRQFLIQMLVNGTGTRYVNGVLVDSAAPNPHLVDILALGLVDSAPQVRSNAGQALSGIAFREIKSSDQLEEWRKSVGDKPLLELIDSGCLSAVTALASAQGEEKVEMLRRLLTIPFYSGRFSSTRNGIVTHGVTVTGLTSRRRIAALSSGFINTVARSLRPENSPVIRELAVKLIAHFAPDDEVLARLEPDLRRELPAALGRGDSYEVYEMLGQMKAHWVTDLLIRRIAEGDFNRTSIAVVLGNIGDPRAIPSLIALYDLVNPSDFLAQVIERSLTQLTKVPYRFNSEHDGDWWRDWWQEHKGELPEDVRKMPFPKLAGARRTDGYSYRRHSERRTVAGASPSDYWLISPGIVAVPSEQSHPGLVVVLSDDPYSSARSRAWQETAGKAWDGRYLVAYVVRPMAAAGKAAPQAAVRELLTAVVKDTQVRAHIDPARVFLLGEGSAGLGVYACSLEKSTPFRGFLLVGSPFRSAQLPPLAAAKGRRYSLVHNKSDRIAPYFLAVAAEAMLKKEGASVVLAALDGAPDDSSTAPARIAALRKALERLETPKTPAVNRLSPLTTK